MATQLKEDPHSLSNALSCKVISSHLSLSVDFTKKILAGYVEHNVEVLKEGSPLQLDSKALVISQVTIILAGSSKEESAQFQVGKETDHFGQQLTVKLPEEVKQVGSSFKARIYYETTTSSSALQWLSPSQTAGKVHPYLFSQCQAIHARSMVPCQDTPSNKIKYTADITVPTPLTALMSATPSSSSSSSSNTKTFSFVQNVPIPTYLIAIAVGNLTSREVGPRSLVWSEPEMVEAGAYEFANTEKFIKTGEDLLTPYTWGRYDILLLPPSFPYGGMENPQLTFVTPTLLAGDRSLENVVAHEIAHSWMGNLVTNRYWSEFFLNEGFTVFIERKILGRLQGEGVFDFEAMIGLKHLQDDVSDIVTNPYTALRPSLDGVDPDDAFSSVPYEKGFTLLCYLQSLVGVADFEAWLKAYVTQFSYQSITADQMKEFFNTYFKDREAIKAIEWDKWFDTPGMPFKSIPFDQKLANASIALAKRWVEEDGKGTSASDIKNFTSSQVVMFLDQLLVQSEHKPLQPSTIASLSETYGFNNSKNSEWRYRWYTLCLKSNVTSIFPKVVEFLKEQGRMKFIRPLYRDLYKNPQGKQLAVETFKQNREAYHAIAARLVAKDLNVD